MQIYFCTESYVIRETGMVYSVQRLATDLTAWVSNPGRGQILHTHLDRPPRPTQVPTLWVYILLCGGIAARTKC